LHSRSSQPPPLPFWAELSVGGKLAMFDAWQDAPWFVSKHWH
jgi:hypothetical protein